MSPETKPEKEKTRETVSPARVNPDHVFSAVADKTEFIEKGRWTYEFQNHLYSDVLKAAYLEGFRITEIQHKDDGTIEIEVTEEAAL